MHLFPKLLPFLGLIIASLSAHASDFESPTEISVDTQIEIIDALKTLVEEEYVLKEKAKLLSSGLSDAVNAGNYDTLRTPVSFINFTNETLQQVFPDHHLKILTPEQYTKVVAIFGAPRKSESKGTTGHIQHSRSGAAHTSKSETRIDREQKGMEALRSTAGITRVSEISRDGVNQVGYLAFERLIDSSKSRNIIDNIFHTFSESERIIIDLRECRGGDEGIVTHISSYFFASPTHLVSSKTRHGETEERWTRPNSLSEVFDQIKVDILVSDQTFSAAESFAFGMQKTGRARIIGNATGGGGYMNDFFPLPNGFGASVSVGRTFDPRTGEGWQSQGVTPEFTFQNDHALSETLKLITEESGKLAEFSSTQIQVYEVIQDYTRAWYNADADAMAQLIASGFQARYSSDQGAVTRDYDQQLAATAQGEGALQKLFHNRIIRNIMINADTAFANLVLRETSHEIRLELSDDGWKITRDDYQDKDNHG